MGKNAIGILRRLLYSSAIKREAFLLDDNFFMYWKHKSSLEYSLECLKMETELLESIFISLGTEQLNYKIRLQALYNTRSVELDIAGTMIQETSVDQYKILFPNEYKSILEKIQFQEYHKIHEIMGKSIIAANSEFTKEKLLFRHVIAVMYVQAIEEVYPNLFENQLRVS